MLKFAYNNTHISHFYANLIEASKLDKSCNVNFHPRKGYAFNAMPGVIAVT